jgi:uncharacterized protein
MAKSKDASSFLKTILEVQEKDMQMLRLLELREEREKELRKLHKLRRDLEEQVTLKKTEVEAYDKELEELDEKLKTITERISKLDEQQSSIRKVDEFNALTQEMSKLDREKAALEQQAQDLTDKMNGEKDVLETIEKSLKESYEGSKSVEAEIQESIDQINKEGKEIKAARDVIAKDADPEILAIYEKLLGNKKDRVVVPIENRACSGCNILITPQHENLVRRAERLVFCEHCSRIHYWPTESDTQTEAQPTKRRRRRATV